MWKSSYGTDDADGRAAPGASTRPPTTESVRQRSRRRRWPACGCPRPSSRARSTPADADVGWDERVQHADRRPRCRHLRRPDLRGHLGRPPLDARPSCARRRPRRRPTRSPSSTRDLPDDFTRTGPRASRRRSSPGRGGDALRPGPGPAGLPPDRRSPTTSTWARATATTRWTSSCSSQRGYCEQFAGVVRGAWPARVGPPGAGGGRVHPGARRPDDPNLYRVRGVHAHAWPEVYLDEYGWVPFEPTPDRGAPPGRPVARPARAPAGRHRRRYHRGTTPTPTTARRRRSADDGLTAGDDRGSTPASARGGGTGQAGSRPTTQPCPVAVRTVGSSSCWHRSPTSSWCRSAIVGPAMSSGAGRATSAADKVRLGVAPGHRARRGRRRPAAAVAHHRRDAPTGWRWRSAARPTPSARWPARWSASPTPSGAAAPTTRPAPQARRGPRSEAEVAAGAPRVGRGSVRYFAVGASCGAAIVSGPAAGAPAPRGSSAGPSGRSSRALLVVFGFVVALEALADPATGAAERVAQAVGPHRCGS